VPRNRKTFLIPAILVLVASPDGASSVKKVIGGHVESNKETRNHRLISKLFAEVWASSGIAIGVVDS